MRLKQNRDQSGKKKYIQILLLLVEHWIDWGSKRSVFDFSSLSTLFSIHCLFEHVNLPERKIENEGGNRSTYLAKIFYEKWFCALWCTEFKVQVVFIE